MKYDNKSFQERYEAWKNGADYWKDIRGVNLGGDTQADEPSEEEQAQMNAKVNQILNEYDAGKDLPRYEDGKGFFDRTADYVIGFEGFEPVGRDTKDGKITIGYGTTDPKWAQVGRRITKPVARKLVIDYLKSRHKALADSISTYNELPESAKMALLSYDYNYYTGNNKAPKLYKALNERNWVVAAREMDAGINQKNFSEGLRKRRESEQSLFLHDLSKYKKPYKYKKPQQSNLVKDLQSNQEALQMQLASTLPKESPKPVVLPAESTYLMPKTQQQIDAEAKADYNNMIQRNLEVLTTPTPLPNAIQNMLQGNNKGKDAYGQKFWQRRGVNLHFYDGKDPYLYPPTDYDFVQARDLGYQPGDDGHWPSRNYKTGRYLKSPVHPTLYKGIISDNSLGYYPYYKDGAIYTNTWQGNEPYTDLLENYIQYRSKKKKGAKK